MDALELDRSRFLGDSSISWCISDALLLAVTVLLLLALLFVRRNEYAWAVSSIVRFLPPWDDLVDRLTWLPLLLEEEMELLSDVGGIP